MCLAVPAKVIEVFEDERATVDLDGVQLQVSLALVDDVVAGDYVIVHVGYALNRLDPDEAARTLELFQEVSRS